MPLDSRTAPFPLVTVVVLAWAALWTVTAELLPAGLLGEIGRTYSAPPSTVGYLVTAWGLTIAVTCLPLARATASWDRRQLLTWSLVLTGAATIATALAPDFVLLVAARTVAAAAHGVFWSQVVVVGTRLSPARHTARTVSVIVAGPTLAGVASIPGVTALGAALGWRPAYGAVGVVIVVAGLLVWRVLPDTPGQVEPAGHRDHSQLHVYVAATCGALLLVAHFMVFTYLSPVLTEHAHLPASDVSLALLAFGAAGLVGVALARWLIAARPRLCVPLSGVALAAALIAVGEVRGRIPVLVAMTLWGVVLGTLPAALQARVLGLATPTFRPIRVP